ncbi:hypothetical protein [Pseudoduganella aquatica]|uniref:hypothetical protein n=1 Tax=Pseudoduganella aquatica TaxID=2660641 RepID=UPI001E2B3CF6|nr:hypothetical protein [Pseudoduganella aquatica]
MDESGKKAAGSADPVTAAVLNEKLADAQTPGFWAEFAPDEAELAGAFEESALGEAEAEESDIDLPPPEKSEAKE